MHGLKVLEGNQFKEQLLTHQYITAMTQDKEGNVWVAANKKVFVYTKDKLFSFKEGQLVE